MPRDNAALRQFVGHRFERMKEGGPGIPAFGAHESSGGAFFFF
jgi:hypothetical protein